MKRLWPLILAVFLISCGADQTGTPTSGTQQKQEAPTVQASSARTVETAEGAYREGELLVKFKSGVASSASRAHTSLRATTVRSYSVVPNLERVKLPDDITVKQALAAYLTDPGVEYAEPNYVIKKVAVVPNDQYFSHQWGLRNIGQFAGGVSGADIKATDAWDVTQGSPSVLVAVLDTGIDLGHPDLAPNICTIDACKGYNFADDNGDVTDDDGHGTHVAGIIAAVGNNALGISGVMWQGKIMPLKILNAKGEGTIADEVAAIEYAINRGAKVINASFAGTSYSQSEYDMIKAARDAGIIFVAAAGNGGGTFCQNGTAKNNDVSPCYPSSYPLENIIAVTATDQTDTRPTWANFGPSKVHVAAPGVYVLSTWPRSFIPLGYEFLSGTSMATPHVTGLVGLLYSYYFDFQGPQIKSMVLNYSDMLSSLSGLTQKGRINAYRSLSSLWAPKGLCVMGVSFSSIQLCWIDRSTAEDGFRIERRTASSAFAPIGTFSSSAGQSQISSAAANEVFYTDPTVIDGTTYFYRVRPYNAIGESAASYSGEISATTLLQAPTNLIVTPLAGGTQVQLTWTDNSQAEEGFIIEIRGGSFEVRAQVGPNVTTYIDSGLTPLSWYTYRVRAFNSAAGPSTYSNEVEIRTTEPAGQQTASGGGGCAMAAGSQDLPDLIFVLLPLIAMIILGMRRKAGR